MLTCWPAELKGVKKFIAFQQKIMISLKLSPKITCTCYIRVWPQMNTVCIHILHILNGKSLFWNGCKILQLQSNANFSIQHGIFSSFLLPRIRQLSGIIIASKNNVHTFQLD